MVENVNTERFVKLTVKALNIYFTKKSQKLSFDINSGRPKTLINPLRMSKIDKCKIKYYLY